MAALKIVSSWTSLKEDLSLILLVTQDKSRWIVPFMFDMFIYFKKPIAGTSLKRTLVYVHMTEIQMWNDVAYILLLVARHPKLYWVRTWHITWPSVGCQLLGWWYATWHGTAVLRGALLNIKGTNYKKILQITLHIILSQKMSGIISRFLCLNKSRR
jgi:hypothetical protein